MPPFALKARAVFPVDQPPIDGGYVTIRGERIVSVGKTTDAAEVRDLGDVAILPGLVNAHTHLEFSGLDSPLGKPCTPLPDWIRSVLSQRGGRRDDVSEIVAQGIAESLAAGVTTVGEIATAAQIEYPQSPEVGLTLFGEVIGFSRPRSVSAFDGFLDWLDPMQVPTRKVPSTAAPRLGVSPHAPYTVHPDLIERLVQYSARRRLPLAMHLAESPEELQLLHSNDGPFRDLLDERGMWDANSIPPGTTPYDYLKQLSNSHRALVIHGNYLDPVKELPFLARHADRMSLIYCPRTHSYFGHAPYPLAEALDQGVRVALGTDSRASNPDLNLFREISMVLEQHPTIAPATALNMATLAGAEALGVADDIGSLSPGKQADLAVVNLPNASSADGLDELLHGIVTESTTQVVATWRHCRCVWQDKDQGE